MLMRDSAVLRYFVRVTKIDAAANMAQSKGQRITFTIEPDLHEPLKIQAQKERRSIGSLINYAIAKYLEDTQGITIDPTIQHGGDRKSKQTKEN